MEQLRRAAGPPAWPVLLLLLALIAVQPPASVYGQAGGPAATATALTAMQQSIFATQTAVYRASATAAAAAGVTVVSPTSTPAATRHAATPGSGRNAVPPAPKPAGAPQPTSTPQPAAQPARAPTAKPTLAPTLAPTAAPEAAPLVEVLVQGLNLRSGPGTGYAILGNASLGDRLPVLGQWGGCAWLQVQLADGRTVWTSGGAMYSRLNVPCTRLAAVAAPTLAAPTAVAAAPAAATPRPQTTRAAAPSSSAAPSNVSAPVLVAPENGADHRFSRITFSWRWNGELQPGWGFAVLAWTDKQPPRAVMDARQTAGMRPNGQGLYSIEVGVPEALSQTSWNWTVVVVQLDPYAQISAEAAPYLLHVDTRLPTPRPDEDDGADGKNPDDN